jgi:hypothetical protein
MQNGTDLRVILSPSANPQTPADVVQPDRSIEVAALKGTTGNQNYDLPVETDLSAFGSVVIYSPTIETIYTFAPLFVRVQ